MNPDEQVVLLPDDDPHGIAVQPVTHLCTATKGSVTPPFLWKEYEKQQQGTSDTYGVLIRDRECVIGTGEQGETDVRSCCALAGYQYVRPTAAQVATYAPLVLLLLMFLGIGGIQKWRRDVKKAIDRRLSS